jgi:hypothetical protein
MLHRLWSMHENRILQKTYTREIDSPTAVWSMAHGLNTIFKEFKPYTNE